MQPSMVVVEESALTRPWQLLAYTNDVDISSLAAAYAASLVKNPSFIDENKLTGFVVGYRFVAKSAVAWQNSASQIPFPPQLGTVEPPRMPANTADAIQRTVLRRKAASKSIVRFIWQRICSLNATAYGLRSHV
jgi:hypothetical protein